MKLVTIAKYEHYWDNITTKLKILEIDFARDFIADDKDGARLSDWLLAVISKENRFVTHIPSTSKKPFERFSIRLPRKGKKIDGRRLKGLYTIYLNWKKKREYRLLLRKSTFQGDEG